MTPASEGTGDRRATRPGRRHAITPHTADAGLLAVAPTLPELFEEVAIALGTFTADVMPYARVAAREAVELEGADLAGLAYAWLNELVGLGDLQHGALVEATVERIDGPADAQSGGPWRLHGHVGLVPYSSGSVRPRRNVKSATYHRLVVRHRGGRWTMRAYLDI